MNQSVIKEDLRRIEFLFQAMWERSGKQGGRSTHMPSSFASRSMTTIKSDVLSLILAPFCIINLTRRLARLYSISGLERGVQRDAGKERVEEAKVGVPGCLCLGVSTLAALSLSASSVSLVGILSICILPICKVDEVDALCSRRRVRVCGAEQKWCRSRSRVQGIVSSGERVSERESEIWVEKGREKARGRRSGEKERERKMTLNQKEE